MREELRLNRQLAAGIYLGVLALRWDGHVFSLWTDAEPSTPGLIVDWLMLMKRLPASFALDCVIARRELQPRDADRLADMLAPFPRRPHRRGPR